MATISDVARMAGVSTMTVSRVLNQSGSVSAQKREAVLRAIAALNYQPNLLARSLATNRSGTIGLIVTVMSNPVYPAYMEGACEQLRKAGLDVIVYYANSFQSTLNGLHTLLNKQADGIITLPLEIHEDKSVKQAFAQAFQQTAKRSGRPIVTIGNQFFLDTIPFVAEDYAAGAELAVRHLYENGHTRIGYLQSELTDYPWDFRTKGYASGMEACGCMVEAAWCPQIPEAFESVLSTVEAWTDAMRASAAGLPSAVYCANDLIALGAFFAMRQCGLRIPQDISIIGHDGTHFTAYTHPRITSVALSPKETGLAVAKMLLDIMNGKPLKSGAGKMMPPQLVQGGTVKCMA